MSNDQEETLSKSERKRQHKALQDFVSALTEAPENQLIRLGLPEDVLDEVRSARKMSKAARNRQIGYISKKVDREVDQETLATAHQTFTAFKHPSAAANAHFHQLEKWRDALISGDNALLENLVSKYGADRQRLRRLIRDANNQGETGKAPVASRQLFQYLRKHYENQ